MNNNHCFVDDFFNDLERIYKKYKNSDNLEYHLILINIISSFVYIDVNKSFKKIIEYIKLCNQEEKEFNEFSIDLDIIYEKYKKYKVLKNHLMLINNIKFREESYLKNIVDFSCKICKKDFDEMNNFMINRPELKKFLETLSTIIKPDINLNSMNETRDFLKITYYNRYRYLLKLETEFKQNTKRSFVTLKFSDGSSLNVPELTKKEATEIDY